MAFNKYLWRSSPVVSGFGVDGLSGDAGKYIRVNSSEMNLEFVAPTGTGSPVNNIAPTIANPTITGYNGSIQTGLMSAQGIRSRNTIGNSFGYMSRTVTTVASSGDGTIYQLVGRYYPGESWASGSLVYFDITHVYYNANGRRRSGVIDKSGRIIVYENVTTGVGTLYSRGPVTYNGNPNVYEIWAEHPNYHRSSIEFKHVYMGTSIPTTSNTGAFEIPSGNETTFTAPDNLMSSIFTTAITRNHDATGITIGSSSTALYTLDIRGTARTTGELTTNDQIYSDLGTNPGINGDKKAIRINFYGNGDQDVSAPIWFGRPGSSSGAGLAAYQATADNDRVGLIFFTHNSATSTDPSTEAARFSSNGNFWIGGTTNLGNDYRLQVTGDAIVTNNMLVSGGITSNSANITSVTAGSITVNGTSTFNGNINATSIANFSSIDVGSLDAGSVEVGGSMTLSGNGGSLFFDGDGYTHTRFSPGSTSDYSGTMYTGTIISSGNFSLTGNFSINSNKFSVGASSGNTLIAGTLTVSGHHTGGSGFFNNFRTPILSIGTSDQGSAPYLESTDNTLELTGNLSVSGDFDVGGSVSYDSISVSDLQLPDGNGEIFGYGGGQVYININSQNNVVFEETLTYFHQNVTIAGDLTVNGAFNFTTSASSLYVDDDVSADYYVARDTTNGFQFFSGTGVTYDGEGGLLLRCNNNVGLRVNSGGGAYAGTAGFSTPKLTISDTSTGILFGDSNTKIYTGSGNLIFRSNGGDGLRIDSTGMAYADTGFSTPTITVSNPSTGILFGDSNTKISTGSGALIFTTGNTLSLVITSGGSLVAPYYAGGGNRTLMVDNSGNVYAV